MGLVLAVTHDRTERNVRTDPVVTATGVAPDIASPSSTVTSEAAPVSVEYERIRVTIASELQCEPRGTDGFDSAIIEAFADRAGQRWRNTVTYPDGTTRAFVVNEPPYGTGQGPPAGARGTDEYGASCVSWPESTGIVTRTKIV